MYMYVYTCVYRYFTGGLYLMCACMHICIMSVLFVHKGVKLQQVSNKSPKYNPKVEMNYTSPQALFD